MLQYFLLIIVVQVSLIGKILWDAISTRRRITHQITRIDLIIPLIEKHPNPELANYFRKAGAEFEVDNDPLVRMLGVCFSNFENMLRQHVSRERLFERHFIRLLQDAMKTLREALAKDDEEGLAEFSFAVYRILFEYTDAEENKNLSQDLEQTLRDFTDYLSDRKKLLHSSIELELIGKWGFQELRESNEYSRFIFSHVARWVAQLPMEYPMNDEIFFEKAKELGKNIEKSLDFAKEENQLGLFMTLAYAFNSLFPIEPSILHKHFGIVRFKRETYSWNPYQRVPPV